MRVPYAVWGWGGPEDEPRTEALRAMTAGTSEHLGFPLSGPDEPGELVVPAPRLSLPTALASLASDDPVDRARHSLGRSYRDLVRGRRGELGAVVDAVLRPRGEDDVARLLDWAADADVALIPFGGGTSVVGGVEPVVGDGYRGVVSLDLGALRRVVEVDPISRAARIEAGALGPDLEAQLATHGLTMRFYPQSFERSTLGGWIATRAAGHFATRLQHVDDLVESVRAVTSQGIWDSRRLPGSGAGPSPDRLLLGSEGTLGVITSAWVRVQERPSHRAGASVAFPRFADGAQAVRAVVQAGLTPAGLRLVDAAEARLTGAHAGGEALLVVGCESTHAPVVAERDAVVALALEHGGRVLSLRGGEGSASETEGADASASWRETFLRAPFLRDALVSIGALVETFETSITWDRLPAFVDEVRTATLRALHAVCGGGEVTVRLTHAYPDGAATYFTVLAPARRGSELAQWADVKAAASDALIAAGGTITHHHAVGRDHRPWYDQQRPQPFGYALRAAKAALDPSGVLNPGVLVDPAR